MAVCICFEIENKMHTAPRPLTSRVTCPKSYVVTHVRLITHTWANEWLPCAAAAVQARILISDTSPRLSAAFCRGGK